MIQILLIEDDKSLSRGIGFKLQREGFKVFCTNCIQEGRNIFESEKINLILLDVGLPDGDGFIFCGEIRKKSDVLIIFLTACDQEVDIVSGYDMGADDYITKPFSLMVLISKINALLRRNRSRPGCEQIESGGIIFYTAAMQVEKLGEKILLSKSELKLFRYFLDNPQQIITREQFLQHLWDIDGDYVDENTLAVNVRRLRAKIEDDPSQPRYIKTVRGIGYIWTERCVSI